LLSSTLRNTSRGPLLFEKPSLVSRRSLNQAAKLPTLLRVPMPTSPNEVDGSLRVRCSPGDGHPSGVVAMSTHTKDSKAAADQPALERVHLFWCGLQECYWGFATTWSHVEYTVVEKALSASTDRGSVLWRRELMRERVDGRTSARNQGVVGLNWLPWALCSFKGVTIGLSYKLIRPLSTSFSCQVLFEHCTIRTTRPSQQY
jgi:hypothetical protein